MKCFNYKKRQGTATSHSLVGWGVLCFVIFAFVSGCPSAKQKNAEVKYKEGLSLYHQGRYQEAAEAYTQAILIKPDYAMAYNDLGAAYADLEHFQEAIVCYKEARRINSFYSGTHFNLGMVYGQLNNWKEAVDAYKEAVRLKPNDVDTLFNLGLAYLALDNKDSALDVLQALRDIDQGKASKLFALIAPSAGYTILEEDKSIQNKITVSILVGKDITEEDIILLLKELCSSYKATYENITIWMFASKKQFESGKLNALAKMALTGDDPWDMHIDRDQLEHLRSQPASSDDVVSSVTKPVIKNNIDICKVEGISIDNKGAVVFVAHGKKFDTVKVGDNICGGDVVKIYAPKELDGVTSSTSSDNYGYRVRMRFVDGERVLKNGDYISGEPQSPSQKPVQDEPKIKIVSSPSSASISVGSDFYRKLCDDVFSAYESATTLDSNFEEEKALQVYKEVIPKAKEAYSTLDLADKGRLNKVIEHAELREREISRYLEAVVPIRGQFNTPETISKWLKNNIHYEKDRVGSDYWQAPYETLTKRTGDCEDYAILAQALLNEIGIRSRIIMVSYNDDYKYKGKAHAMCVFQRDGVYEYFSGHDLKKPNAFSIEKIMDQDYPEWLTITELDYKTKTRVDIAKKVV